MAWVELDWPGGGGTPTPPFPPPSYAPPYPPSFLSSYPPSFALEEPRRAARMLPSNFIHPSLLADDTSPCAPAQCFVCWAALPRVALTCGHCLCAQCYRHWLETDPTQNCWFCRCPVQGSHPLYLMTSGS